MCGETHYFVDCAHETDVYVPCTWADQKYHRFLSLTKEGLCRSCNRDELINALTGHCPNPREAATNMLKAIKEIRGKELPTPERVVNFLKTSKRAKMALQRMMAPHQMDWLADWLYSRKWGGAEVDAGDCGRQDADVEKCVKKRRKRKSPVRSAGSWELSTYNTGLGIDNSAHQDLPAREENGTVHSLYVDRGSELDWTLDLDSCPRRPKPKNLSMQDNNRIAAPPSQAFRPFSPVADDIATINAPQPQRPFNSTLLLDKTPILSLFHHHKVPKLDLPDGCYKGARQCSASTSGAAQTLRSQWDKDRYLTPGPKTAAVDVLSAADTVSNSSHRVVDSHKPKVPGIDIPFPSPLKSSVSVPSTEQELQIIQYIPVPVAVSRSQGPRSPNVNSRANVEVDGFEAVWCA